jgi:hypothetical protein
MHTISLSLAITKVVVSNAIQASRKKPFHPSLPFPQASVANKPSPSINVNPLVLLIICKVLKRYRYFRNIFENKAKTTDIIKQLISHLFEKNHFYGLFLNI